MNYKTKVNIQGQIEKHFTPGGPLLLSIIFNWGEVESASLIPAETFSQTLAFGRPLEMNFDSINTSWRYGRLTGSIWIRALTPALFLDEVKKRFNEILSVQQNRLCEEAETIEKALSNIQNHFS